MLQRKLNTTLLIANGVYILYFLLMMITLKQPIIEDLHKPSVSLSREVISAIQVVMSILSLLIFIGLAAILSRFKEKPWIIASVCVFLLVQLFFNVLTLLSLNGINQLGKHLSASVYFYLNWVLIIYLAASLLFVKEPFIKAYYKWFGLCVLLSMLLVRGLPMLYESFNISWLLINPGLIKIIPYFVSFLLFVKISKNNKKRSV